MSPNVHIFLDTTNVFVGAQFAARRPSVLHPIRLQFDHLLRLARAGRTLRDAVAVTTGTGRNDGVLCALARAGFRVLSNEPGSLTGREVCVDERLHLEMYKAAAHEEPGIAVLLTGDGAGTGRDGFVPALKVLTRAGWSLELLSWEASCSRDLRNSVESVGGLVQWLDPYWLALTFEQSGRRASELSLRSRRRVGNCEAA